MGVYKFSDASSLASDKVSYKSMLAGNTTWLPWEPQGAYDALATITVPSGGAATVTFAGIPNTYKHLQLRVFAQSNRTSFSVDNLFGTVNGDSSASYAYHQIQASTSTTTAATAGGNSSQTALTIGGINSGVATNVFTACVVDYLDYASTSKFKTIRSLNGYDVNGTVGTSSFGGTVGLYSSLYMKTGPITSISFNVLSGTAFTQYSQFTLYGVK
jgi:hypothetical protein